MRLSRRIYFHVLWLIVLSTTTVLFQNCGRYKAAGAKATTESSLSAPSVTVTSAPRPVMNLRDFLITFAIDAGAAPVQTTCQLDAAPAVNCISQFQVTGAADGDHVVKINVEDGRGIRSQETFVRWTVDATKPIVQINSSPAAITGSKTAQVNFTASDNLTNISDIECSFDGGAFSPCTSPRSFSNLTEAVHTLKVHARDGAGNQSDEVSATWRVDQTAPVIQIVSGPSALTNARSATFTFSGADQGAAIASFQCALDDGVFNSCSSPTAFNSLADGSHTFHLKGVDSVGNLSTEVTNTWTVDGTAPSMTFVSTPPALGNSTSATFQFTAADGSGSGIARTECSLDGSAFAACTSPKSYSGLANGSHIFRTQAFDKTGNSSPVLSFTFAIDLTAPAVAISSGPGTSTSSTSATFQFAASDASGIAATTCVLDQQSAACASPVNYTNLAAGTHSFTVLAVDRAGNQARADQSWTITASQPPPQPSGVIFFDDFLGTTIDPAKWTVLNRISDQVNAELNCVTPQNVSVKNGMLEGVSKFEDHVCGDSLLAPRTMHYTSWHIQQATPSFLYGTIEVRAKIPGGIGLWPLIWMLGNKWQASQPATANTPEHQWPAGDWCEIDIAEFWNNSRTTVNTTVHYQQAGQLHLPALPFDATTRFMVYRLQWTMGSLIWSVNAEDGRGFQTLYSISGATKVPNVPMYVILSTAIGGSGGGTPNPNTFPQTYLVDYVRITQ